MIVEQQNLTDLPSMGDTGLGGEGRAKFRVDRGGEGSHRMHDVGIPSNRPIAGSDYRCEEWASTARDLPGRALNGNPEGRVARNRYSVEQERRRLARVKGPHHHPARRSDLLGSIRMPRETCQSVDSGQRWPSVLDLWGQDASVPNVYSKLVRELIESSGRRPCDQRPPRYRQPSVSFGEGHVGVYFLVAVRVRRFWWS